MKKLLLILILLPSLCFAGSIQDMHKAVIARINSVDTIAPQYVPTGSEIDTDGTTVTLNFSENLTGTESDTFNLDCDGVSGADVALTYSSGSGTTALVFTAGATIQSTETCNLDFDGDSNDFEDDAGNDLADFSDAAVTNSSEQGGAPVCSSTPAVSLESTTDYDSVGDSVGNGYRGQANFVPASNGTICRIDFYIHAVDAETDWAAVVYNMTGNDLGAEVDASDTMALAGNDQWTSFTNLSAAVTTGGSYGLVMQHYPISYTSGATMYHSAAGDGGVVGNHWTWWGDDKSQHDTWTGDISIKIYYLE